MSPTSRATTADVDENSHGTHVASTIASPINKLGMAGVAPEVTIVNIRAGQDSGFFFLQRRSTRSSMPATWEWTSSA